VVHASQDVPKIVSMGCVLLQKPALASLGLVESLVRLLAALMECGERIVARHVAVTMEGSVTR